MPPTLISILSRQMPLIRAESRMTVDVRHIAFAASKADTSAIARAKASPPIHPAAGHPSMRVSGIIRAAHDQLMMAKRAGGDRVEWAVHVPPGHSVAVLSPAPHRITRGKPARVTGVSDAPRILADRSQPGHF